MRFIKKALRWLVLALLALLLVLGWYVWRSQPVLDGERSLPGLAAQVSVRRDASDVVHIQATRSRDAWMALGYVHAQERGWQLEFNRRLMRGELSEVLGPKTLETDMLMRTLGIRQAAQRQMATMSEETTVALKAYADGVNAYFAQRDRPLPPEFHLLRIDPSSLAAEGRYWEPEDSAGWSLMMALDLGGNWGNELARLAATEVLDTRALWELFPPYPGEPPAATADLSALYRRLGLHRQTTETMQTSSLEDGAELAINDWARSLGDVEGKGSNNWVVDGTRSASGQPLLANDPHLGLSAPAIWYFAHLQAPDVPGLAGMNVIGATLPGTPFVVLGRTEGVAWGFTNTGPDVQDLFIEQLDPKTPGRYRLPDEQGQAAWATFTERREIIRVKGQEDVVHVVRHSRHGPVLSDMPGRARDLVDTERYALALSWTALAAENHSATASLMANRAQSVPELTEAFRGFLAPMQNVVMADRSGRIAYKAVGRVPVRRADNDIRGVAPAPGWDSRYDWTGWLPYEETPADDGHRGWIATANQRIHAADYPHFLTQDWAAPYRQQRIESLLAQQHKHDMTSFQRMQGDVMSEATMRLLPHLLASPSAHPLAAAAKAQLQGFDGQMRADSAAALIYTAWVDEFTRGVVGERLGQARFVQLYGKRLFRNAVEDILEQDKRDWCGAGGCRQASGAALDRALEKLRALQGDDVARWRWGREHPAISVHRPMSNVALLAPMFEVRVETGGDPFTLNVGQYHLDKADAPYANRHAASLRAIYDLAEPENSVFIYQAGQSGNVFSSRYRDMSDEWAAVQYRPLRMRPDHWRHELVLKP